MERVPRLPPNDLWGNAAQNLGHEPAGLITQNHHNSTAFDQNYALEALRGLVRLALHCRAGPRSVGVPFAGLFISKYLKYYPYI